MDATLGYRYSNLEGSTVIRTVELLSLTGDDLECILDHGRLDELRYQCLSYVWGKPEKPYKIIVRDRDSKTVKGYIPLTKNLYNALKDLRDSPEIERKVFWIDQICIHQEDNDEKGRQVALMGEIYRHASAVIMYLGPAGAHDADGMALITLLYEHFEPCLQPIINMTWFFAYRRSEPLPVEDLPHDVTLEHPGWPGLLEMAFGPWLERTWIVQENVLNKRTFMLRGQKTMNWVSVAAIPIFFGVELLPVSLLEDVRKNKNSSLDCYVDAVCRSLESRYRKSPSSSPIAPEDFLTLGENLEWYDALDCADPRDHIYSILALSTDVAKLGIRPNYSNSVPAVFVDATVRMLTTYKAIRQFHYVSLLDNLSDPSYPSWSLTPRLLGRQHYLDHMMYTAHPSSTAEFEFDTTYSEMMAKGCILDRICFTSPGNFVRGSTFWGVTELENAERLVNELFAYAVTLDSTGTTRHSVAQLLISIIAEKFQDSAGSDVRRNPVLSLWCYLRFSGKPIIENKDDLREDARNKLPSIGEMIASVADLAGKRDAPDPTEEEWRIGNLINSQKITYGRSFCTTDHHVIINCTFKAAIGDCIALLQGGRLPFVLRPVGDRFQYVGDACVPGIMFGEAYKDRDTKDDYDIRLI